jgi:hypothetical protein
MDWTAFWAQFMPPPKNQPYAPTYLPQQYVSQPGNDGSVQRQPINVFYFATLETANWLLAKYNSKGSVLSVPFEGAGGPDIATSEVLELVWPNGVAINAGLLASLWTQNAGSPDTADALVKSAIAARGAQ